MQDRLCKNCEILFHPRRFDTMYCNRKCRDTGLTKGYKERFWSKVQKTEGCWIWKGGRHAKGYGIVRAKLLGENKAHRASYRMVFGDIPDGLHVLHHCDNPPCVRPDHLFLGTNYDNVLDKMAKGRAKGAKLPGERHPMAKLTDDKVREIRTKYAAGGICQRELAEQYGVSTSMIGLITIRKNWIHI